MTTFFDLDAASRVACVDHVVGHLNKHLDTGELTDLAPATVAWLEQIKHALADDDFAEDAFNTLDGQFTDYLDTVSDAEARAVNAHFLRFAFVANRMPLDGTSPDDWFKANLGVVSADETVGDWLVRLTNDDQPATVGNRAQRRGRHRRRHR